MVLLAVDINQDGFIIWSCLFSRPKGQWRNTAKQGPGMDIREKVRLSERYVFLKSVYTYLDSFIINM